MCIRDSLVRFRTDEACTTVRVGRLIDGINDGNPVEALYRDKEGFNCDGQPTRAQQELDAERLAQEQLEAAEQAGGGQLPPVPTIPSQPTTLVPSTIFIPPGQRDRTEIAAQ